MSTTDSATVTMNQLASVIGRAASDPAFREQLVTSPASTLQSAGVAIPSGAEVKAVEESQVARYAVVPSRPSWLSDADLSQLVTQSLPLPSSVEQKIAAYGLLVAKSWADSSVRTMGPRVCSVAIIWAVRSSRNWRTSTWRSSSDW